MEMHSPSSKHVTLLLNGGLLDPATMQAVTGIARQYNLLLYCTTSQNLRLLGANNDNLGEIKNALLDLGLQIKAPGRFPLPRVCVGKPYCNLGLADTFALADQIAETYGGRTGIKPKIKIAVAGCPAGCSGSLLADIGLVATRKGFNLYVGGKGGPLPRIARKVASGLTEAEALVALGRLVEFHTSRTQKKQRLCKLLENDDFPYPLRN